MAAAEATPAATNDANTKAEAKEYAIRDAEIPTSCPSSYMNVGAAVSTRSLTRWSSIRRKRMAGVTEWPRLQDAVAWLDAHAS